MFRSIPCGIASEKQIINIVRRSLSQVDERLIEHGERVAYIADMLASMDPTLDVDKKTLFVLCILHDIGAYKTEEIDDMVVFETDSVVNHAAYGYVFLRNCTILGEAAEAIRYHHTNYDQFAKIDTPYKTYAELIFLSDRIDILLSASGPVNLEPLRRLSGTAFSPRLTELFFLAEEKLHLSAHIRDGSYKSHVNAMIDAACFSEEEVMSYLKMLVYSIDFRSPFTVTHTANTVSISVALSKLFVMSEAEQNAIALGAFLHDIGKLAIPYSILEKPGALTPEQMDVMKTHVAISERILSGVVSDEVCQIAVRHHEKLNGRGYHRGLCAPELTRAQRIVAVSDILSALMSRRSYKEPFPAEKSIAIIERMRDNGELCPEVCDMTIRNFDEIMRITDRADDPVIKLYETIKRQYDELIAAYDKPAPAEKENADAMR